MSAYKGKIKNTGSQEIKADIKGGGSVKPGAKKGGDLRSESAKGKEA
ncbi:MAG: hypothetical protein VB120_04980 [Lachnospiraceae bacterium]|nr:hypothetical protein [Lachnospiraceae bacterium]